MGEVIVMKEWFGNKLANEIKSNICSDRIFAVLKETEKAMYVMISVAPARSKCTWIPKSATERAEAEHDHHVTRYISDYDECLSEFKAMWSNFM